MRIIIGTMFAGQIKSLHQQYISTKLFFFIIPIFPTMSMLVVNREFLSGRKGIEIPMNKLSTIAAYMRIISIPVAVLLYLLIDDLTSWQKISALLLSISLLVYVWFFLVNRPQKKISLGNKWESYLKSFLCQNGSIMKISKNFRKKQWRITNKYLVMKIGNQN